MLVMVLLFQYVRWYLAQFAVLHPFCAFMQIVYVLTIPACISETRQAKWETGRKRVGNGVFAENKQNSLYVFCMCALHTVYDIGALCRYKYRHERTEISQWPCQQHKICGNLCVFTSSTNIHEWHEPHATHRTLFGPTKNRTVAHTLVTLIFFRSAIICNAGRPSVCRCFQIELDPILFMHQWPNLQMAMPQSDIPKRHNSHFK